MVTVYNSGPINIEQGNSANFAVEFLDSDGNRVVPTSGTLTIAYLNITNTAVSETISLSEDNSFFTGTWSSTSAALGLATWQATMAGSATVQAAGQIRVIQRQSSY